MSIRELSSHLNRDKKDNDPLEDILEPWGVWRAWGVEGLSSSRKSPIVAIIQLERKKTDIYDLVRYMEIKDYLLVNGFSDRTPQDRAILRSEANRLWKEWKTYINQLNVPRETKITRPADPKYGGHAYYSKIDRVLSEIYGPYYNILIHKYEELWDKKEFIAHNNWTEDIYWNNIKRARNAARKILKKNGYKT